MEKCLLDILEKEKKLCLEYEEYEQELRKISKELNEIGDDDDDGLMRLSRQRTDVAYQKIKCKVELELVHIKMKKYFQELLKG